jgi:hypothetical protein
MRRPPHHHRHHRHHQWHRHGHHPGPGRGPFGLLLLLLGVMLVAGGALLVATLVAMLMALAPLMLAGAAAVAVMSSRHRNQAAVAWASRPVGLMSKQAMPKPARAHSRTSADWAAARARFAQLRSEYGQFECDPLAVLRLPALTDVTVPSTGRFVDAFAEAQALDTDTEPSPAHQAGFAAAVDRAWRAWRAAVDAAERIRLAGIPERERATVQRTIKLLTMARDSDHAAERAAAYARARTELAKLDRTGTLRLPPAAAAALDAAARGQLPPAPAAD